MSRKLELYASENNTERIDKLITSEYPEMTRSFVQKLLSEKMVKVNGVTAGKSYIPRHREHIEITVPEARAVRILPENIPLDIIYEDSELLIVNKPRGMVVHPAVGNESTTLVNALLYHCGNTLSGINGEIRPGIVHRIDKDTSGLLIVAKNNFSHNKLAQQIKEHTFTRRYEAVVYGKFRESSFTVEAPIGRHPTDRKRMAVTQKNSRSAVTHVKVIKQYRGFSHVRLTLETGRTHQIRVHMAYLGHPVAGDPVYGPKKVITELNGQCLHARTIGFVHPRTGEYMEFSSELPDYFSDFLQKLKEE